MTLRLDGVTVTYPDGADRRTVLHRVDLRVAAGEFLAVTGPSGSGKSTLLAVAGALLRPDTGQVHIGDAEITAASPRRAASIRRTRIGFVFQEANLLPALTALDQLLLVPTLAGDRPAHLRDRARRLLNDVGVAQRAHARSDHLSGGERQRVALARALMNEPTLLLVDEPTASIDHTQATTVVNLLAAQAHRHGCALVMVTHDATALSACDRTVELAELNQGPDGGAT
ncbi:MAG: ABC transporter ATP-binding protein [Pseudonocardiales bacterium]|nr:MAG: ABC transporter ATP-binding protein [Pseudonocardiales bacterium]